MSLLRRAARSRLMASDDYNHPDEDVLEGMSFQEFGSVIVGEEGKLFFHRGHSDFSLAGPLTATILLGVLAQRFPDATLEWDAARLEVKDRPELKQAIQRPCRDGWKVDV